MSEWTIDTLREYLDLLVRNHDAMVAEVDRRYQDRHKASKEAILKAEAATELRFESVNEFRAQLADQASRFLPRSEADAEMTALRAELIARSDHNAARIAELTDRLNRAEGKGAGLNAGWIYLLSAVAALGTIFTLFFALRGG